MEDIEKIMTDAGMKPTSNRVLVLRELINADSPLSLGDLEALIGTLEKSSVLRALAVCQEHHLIHAIEDGRGVTRYEVCNGTTDGRHDDMHVHFYCLKCRQTSCFEHIMVPRIDLPENYLADTATYLVKGICPQCQKGAKR
ncbi:MAG: transcriptional repressor [Bacteroidales bacterium]|nr:transcriptional repressor [Bacteroidales bacterium]